MTKPKKLSGRLKHKPVPNAKSAFAEPGLKLQREKQLALWAGVIFFMTIVVSVWALTFKQNVQSHVSAPAGDTPEIAELLGNVNQAFSQTKEELSVLKQKINPNKVSDQSVRDSEMSSLERRLSEMEQRLELERFLYRFNTELEKQAQVLP